VGVPIGAEQRLAESVSGICARAGDAKAKRPMNDEKKGKKAERGANAEGV
jgi:hypothetical protein